MNLKVLSVDDEKNWTDKLQQAIPKELPIEIDVAEEYGQAQTYIKKNQYDLLVFDSRIKVKEKILPAVNKLINCAKENFQGYDRPIILISNYLNDISEEQSKQIFESYQKNQLESPTALKLVILKGIIESISKKISYISQNDSQDQKSYNKTYSPSVNQLPQFDLNTTDGLIDFQTVIKGIMKNVPNMLLELTGHVIELQEQNVIVQFYLPNKKVEQRTFSADWFKDAGLYYQDACFTYTMERKGTQIISDIRKSEPVIDNEYVKYLNNIDLNIFPSYN